MEKNQDRYFYYEIRPQFVLSLCFNESLATMVNQFGSCQYAYDMFRTIKAGSKLVHLILYFNLQSVKRLAGV